MNTKKRKRVVNLLVRSVGTPIQQSYVSSGIGKASFIHALVVIFLEFFAWGLLTDQVITVLNDTFPNSTFLANGLIHGLKGILSFLSAPLIGAMSDIWGRKIFLLITVFFTCLPIPLMRINPMWYFAMISISGLFAVTFSVVFAYVADVTDESNRTTAYGLVSATFAASLITSPALGSYLSRFYSEKFVVALATAIAIFDLFFILVAVPESLPEKLRERNKTITWDNIDPFKALKVVFADRTISLLCITVFLSYLPEAGQFSCFFIYLKLIVGFSQSEVAYFIAYVGILSCICQAAILIILIKYFGSRQSIIIGLSFQVLQLTAYAFSAQSWLIWFSGLLAAMSSIGYPAISAFISQQSHIDQQGVSQGMVTGIRGLCNGIGPALYGFIFWIFRVSLNETNNNNHNNNPSSSSEASTTKNTYASTHLLPGPPFLFGAVLALIAMFVTYMIPSNYKTPILLTQKNSKERTVVKLANSTASYNRTSSTSSLTAANLININMENNSDESLSNITNKSQEEELLLPNTTNANIMSFFSSNTNMNQQNIANIQTNPDPDSYYVATNPVNETSSPNDYLKNSAKATSNRVNFDIGGTNVSKSNSSKVNLD